MITQTNLGISGPTITWASVKELKGPTVFTLTNVRSNESNTWK